MSTLSRKSSVRYGGAVAVVLVAAAAVVVLAVPTPGNAAAIGIRDTDICVGKCLDRHVAESERCHQVTIQPAGVLWNTSVSQSTGDDREDPVEACLLKADAALAACIEDCDSRSTPLVGRDGAVRSSFWVSRRR